jgi:hypothetical protein
MAIPSPCAPFALAGVFADVNFSNERSLNYKRGRASHRISSYSYSAKRYSVKRYSYSMAVELRRFRSVIESEKKQTRNTAPVAASLGPAGIKPTEAKKGSSVAV